MLLLFMLYHVPCTMYHVPYVYLNTLYACMSICVCVSISLSISVSVRLPHRLMKPVGNFVDYLCKFLNGP